MRYFDQLSISCTGCRFFATDEYPDGTPYKACRYFGYIFHEDKGVSSELCDAKRTDYYEIKSTPKNLKELKKDDDEMIYDLSKEIDRERLATRVKALTAKGAMVEFTEKAVRSNSQNRYLHALLGALAIDTGETLEYVKEMYFKRLANREIFISTKVDKYCGTVEEVRSSADLSVEEMSVAIDRLKRWAAQEGFYLPEPGDEERILDIEREILRMKRYI